MSDTPSANKATQHEQRSLRCGLYAWAPLGGGRCSGALRLQLMILHRHLDLLRDREHREFVASATYKDKPRGGSPFARTDLLRSLLREVGDLAFDVVLVTSLSVFGNDTAIVIEVLTALHWSQTRLISISEQIDTSNPEHDFAVGLLLHVQAINQVSPETALGAEPTLALPRPRFARHIRRTKLEQS